MVRIRNKIPERSNSFRAHVEVCDLLAHTIIIHQTFCTCEMREEADQFDVRPSSPTSDRYTFFRSFTSNPVRCIPVSTSMCTRALRPVRSRGLNRAFQTAHVVDATLHTLVQRPNPIASSSTMPMMNTSGSFRTRN